MKHTLHEIELKNGAKGLLINVPDATVMTYEINFVAGDFLCEPEKWETAHIMEHMALGANQAFRSSRKFNAIFEQNGAYNNASTGPYDMNYEAECADFEWQRILDLMLLAITKPLFLEKEFTAEFGNVQEELAQRSNSHSVQLNLKLREMYGFCSRTFQDRQKLIKNVTLDDIRKHYKKTHYIKNMRFVIAGNINPERRDVIIKMLEKMDLPEGDVKIEHPIEVPIKLKKALYIQNKTVPNMHFYFDTFSTKGKLTEPETDSVYLVNNVLTGTLHSRILGRAREKGLVYGIGSNWYWSKGYTGWWIGAQVSRQNAPALFDVVVREVRRVLNGNISYSDLKASKEYALGVHQRSIQTVSQLSSMYTGKYFSLGEYEHVDAIPARLRGVTRPRAISSFSKLFEEKVYGLGFLGTVPANERKVLDDKIASIWN